MRVPVWFSIVVAWAVLLTATVITVKVCRENAPQEVPLVGGAFSDSKHGH